MKLFFFKLIKEAFHDHAMLTCIHARHETFAYTGISPHILVLTYAKKLRKGIAQIKWPSPSFPLFLNFVILSSFLFGVYWATRVAVFLKHSGRS